MKPIPTNAARVMVSIEAPSRHEEEKNSLLNELKESENISRLSSPFGAQGAKS